MKRLLVIILVLASSCVWGQTFTTDKIKATPAYRMTASLSVDVENPPAGIASFNSEVEDVGDCYATSTVTYTVPETGLYAVMIGAGGGTAQYWGMEARIYAGGSTEDRSKVTKSYAYLGTTGGDGASVGCRILYLTKGDTIRPWLVTTVSSGTLQKDNVIFSVISIY